MFPQTLLSLTFEEFKKLVQEMGLEGFRATQVWDWVFRKLEFDYNKMTNLSTDARKKLTERFPQIVPQPSERLKSDDGTVKAAIMLSDGARVEAVSIPDDDSVTFCLSCQIGCSIACAFCRTGSAKIRRNLTSNEILLQFLVLCSVTGKRPTNIVFMGMGEPFLNRQALFTAIDTLTDKKGLGFATRRITISTSGITDGILELSERPGEVNLAVSLHSADDSIRTRLVPGNRKNGIAKIRNAVSTYIERTGRRVTFEIVLLRNMNDHISDAMNLANFCKGLLCHINIVRLNPYPGCPFQPATEASEKEYRNILKKEGIPVTVRRPRGGSILAACGQLSGNVPCSALNELTDSE